MRKPLNVSTYVFIGLSFKNYEETQTFPKIRVEPGCEEPRVSGREVKRTRQTAAPAPSPRAARQPATAAALGVPADGTNPPQKRGRGTGTPGRQGERPAGPGTQSPGPALRPPSRRRRPPRLPLCLPLSSSIFIFSFNCGEIVLSREVRLAEHKRGCRLGAGRGPLGPERRGPFPRGPETQPNRS